MNSCCIKLDQTTVSLAKDLYKSLRKRIENRSIVHSSLLNFLKNPNDSDKDLDTSLIKSELKALKLRFAKGLEKIPYHSTLIIASQIRRTILPFI